MNKLAQGHSEAQKEAQSDNKKSSVFAQAQQNIDAARAELKRYNEEADRRDAQPVGFSGAMNAAWDGAVNEFADNTLVGRLFVRPHVDTPIEQRERLNRRIMTAEKSLLFNQQSERNRIQQEQAWTRDITAHKTMIDKHILGTLEANPRFMVMTDKQKLAIKDNPSVQKFLNTNTLFRMGIDVFVNGKDRGAMDYYAKKLGVKITEKDGKHYIQFPDPDSKPIEINHTNFVALHNDINKKASQDIATLVALEEQKNNLPGISRGQKVSQITPLLGNSPSAADKYQNAFMAGFDGIEQRKHYAVIGMDKIFSDGKVDPQEKEELLAQLSFLSQRMGIKSTQDAQGNIFIINDDGTQTPIQQFHKEFKAQDKIGIEWNKRVKSLNLVAMQKAQLETAKRKAKLAELGYGEKADKGQQIIKELDAGGVLKNSSYTDSEKNKYEKLLKDVAFAYKTKGNITAVKRMWDNGIKDMGISINDAPFPYSKKYYPQAISEARKEFLQLQREVRGVNYSEEEWKKIEPHIDISRSLSEIFGDERQASRYKKAYQAEAKAEKHGEIIKKRNKAWKKLKQLLAEYKEEQ